MADLKLIHAADIHLGRPFSGLERSNPELGDLFRRATYTAWERIVTTAIERKADLVTLGGDVFDASSPTVKSRVAFSRGIDLLREAGIRVFMALGNHDPMTGFPPSLMSLPGLHLFGKDPESVRPSFAEAAEGVAIFGASFHKSATKENLARQFRRDPGLDLAIGVLHANVSGIGGHKDYAPCTLDDLKSTGMDLWCLGHVHAGGVLRDDPLILYAGAAQGAHMGETGPHGCFLINAHQHGNCHAEFVPVSPVRWEVITIDAAEAEDGTQLLNRAEQACSKLCSGDGNLESLVVGVHIKGLASAELRKDLRGKEELFDALADALARLPVPVFVESLRDLTREPRSDISSDEDQGFALEFARLCREVAGDPGKLVGLSGEIVAELSRKVGFSYISGDSRAGNFGSEKEAMDYFLAQAQGVVQRMLGDSVNVD